MREVPLYHAMNSRGDKTFITANTRAMYAPHRGWLSLSLSRALSRLLSLSLSLARSLSLSLSRALSLSRSLSFALSRSLSLSLSLSLSHSYIFSLSRARALSVAVEGARNLVQKCAAVPRRARI